MKRDKPAWILAFAILIVAKPAAAGEERTGQTYWRFRDANGVLHITNVRGASSKWQRWKKVSGSGGRGAEQIRRAPLKKKSSIAGNHERQHRYDSIIRAAVERYQMPEPLVRAVIHTESNYYSRAVSSAGARGLMQLMPVTAKELGVRDSFDPKQNIHGGTKLLRLLANRFNGDLVLVLAGYHAGAGAVKRYGGVPPYQSTRAYIKAVLRRYYAYEKQAESNRNGLRRAPARNIAG